jgi:hypothetical protein
LNWPQKIAKRTKKAGFGDEEEIGHFAWPGELKPHPVLSHDLHIAFLAFSCG